MYNDDYLFTLAGYEFRNLISTSGCNILTVGNLGNFNKLKEAFVHILKRDEDYAQVGLLQFGASQTYFIPRFKEVFGDFIRYEQKVPGGHGNGDCTLFLIDLKTLRSLDLPDTISENVDEEEDEEDYD